MPFQEFTRRGPVGNASTELERTVRVPHLRQAVPDSVKVDIKADDLFALVLSDLPCEQGVLIEHPVPHINIDIGIVGIDAPHRVHHGIQFSSAGEYSVNRP
ncbi:hypothetical protein [Streptomyces lavendulae]|uniref:hypothetical protein n=1 Tax=Streptomyces lavendulae TaxID=1914 RepID=UPI0031E6462B